MPARSAASTSSSKTFGERVEPRPITGPEPSAWLPFSFSSIPGASVAWVTSTATARSGSSAKAEVPPPLQADLLLDRGDAGDAARVAAALLAAPRELERDVGAEPVVHRARDQAIADQLSGGRIDHGRVADPEHLLRLVAVGGADVDVQAVEL